MTSGLTAASFNSAVLGVNATSSAVLYQRNATNVLNASASTPINIGQLTANQTQLDVNSQVTSGNQNDYYTFNFGGGSPLKLAFSNLTQTDSLRFQLLDSNGNIVADSQGTTAQQLAYIQLTGSSTGLTTAAGQYTARVSYAPTATKVLAQNYSLSFYSGNSFNSAYQTNAAPQTSASTPVPVDNTQTFATSDAQLFTRQGFNTIGDTALTGVNIGWLSENTSSLNVQSQLTTADPTDFYQFTLQQGSNIKLAFNNTTASTSATPVRVQVTDATGLEILADSQGTAAQRAAYAALTSSTGISVKPAQYAVKVTYAPGANHSQTQDYNFQLYSGVSYANSYETIASAQTIGNAILTGNPNVAGYSASNAAASYLNSFSQGTAPDVLAALSTLV